MSAPYGTRVAYGALPMRPVLLTIALACGAGCDDAGFVEVSDFGANPGGLRMFEHAPDGDGALGLFVMLHGCNQNHDAARTSGLLEIGDERGLVVIAPEQSAFNNGSLCFNWFNADDTDRDGDGEARSIRAMIDATRARHAIDDERVYVAGLSAGAALAASLMASFPDVIRGGAALAGGPHGCARSVVDAADCMAHTGAAADVDAAEWAERVRDASPMGDDEGFTAWPRLFALAGADDIVVSPAMTDALVAQWATLHGADPEEPTASPAQEDTAQGDADVDDFGPDVRRVVLDGVDHTLPIDDEACGEEAPFVSDIGFCAMRAAVDYLERN